MELVLDRRRRRTAIFLRFRDPNMSKLEAVDAKALREAAERVVWFDWSDNDPDAVAAIERLRATLAAQPAPDHAGLIAGWNACRKSIYAVCEDVDREAEDTYLKASSSGSATSTEGHLTEFQSGHVSGYRSGMVRAAKSIARGFNSMEAMDDDNLREAIAALSRVGPVAVKPQSAPQQGDDK